MILARDSRPEDMLYCIGAWILDALSRSRGKGGFTQAETVYDALRDEYRISPTSFQLGIDWLFLLGAVEKNEEGEIRLCS
ncbi:ABC-three component system middle component 6 [Olsenella sp. Marseille-P4559]|jgi:hypothetical protein|uniref:ABC-three component system middle component 6 n=1 Tax=Olsenella sp. Marseille-P4559 TaxID=2364795 RepID=UPI0010319815|nr:ABC-three component system middle component 6 [Olsenella sp. Marseille-P4559]MCH3948863.1 hypothetical protein [Olsenella sp.]